MKKSLRYFLCITLLFVLTGCTGKEKSINFQVADGYLQWQYVGESSWNNVISIDDLNNKENGKSAYEIAVSQGYKGTEIEWLNSLKGSNGQDGQYGTNGKSAYELAVANGFKGTEVEWLESLKGTNGKNGLSAYELAISQGFKGTEKEWLESLKGTNGSDGTNGSNGSTGKSVYDIAKELGYTGTEVEWLESLKGDQGDNGYSPFVGQNGNWWIGETDTNIRALERNMDRVGTDGLIFQLTIKNGIAGYEVIGYDFSNYQSGDRMDVVIPNLIFEKPVISIRADVFPSDKLTALSISKYTEYLPNFQNYSRLESFDYNNATTKDIPEKMFYGCSSLKEINNYSNVENIGDYAFYGTKFYTLDFTNIKKIGQYAFNNTMDSADLLANNTNGFIFVPKNVSEIGRGAFDSELIVYYEGNTTNVISSSDYNFYNVIHNNGYYYQDEPFGITILNYDGEEKRLAVPTIIDGKQVTKISNFGFAYNTTIERIELPNSLSTIGVCAFVNTVKLHSLFVPKSVSSIGDEFVCVADDDLMLETPFVFYEATTFDLTGGITSPDQLDAKRYMIGIKPSDIDDDNTCIYQVNSLSCDVVSIKISNGMADIPSTFNNLPVVKINKYALYYNCYTKFINIPSTVTKIASYAFTNSGLKGINVPNSVSIVNYRGFNVLSNCKVYIQATAIPSDWDSSWYYNINTFILDSQVKQKSEYIYSVDVNNEISLLEYIGSLTTNTPIIIPSTIDGKTVTTIKEYCFDFRNIVNSNTNRFIFVIPSTINTIEANGLYLKDYGYSTIYLSIDTISSSWSYNWAYGTYGYNSRSGYISIKYNGQWSMIEGVPIAN